MTPDDAQLPHDLAELIGSCTWQATSGCSGAAVYRLTRPNGSQLYLKCGADEPDRRLADECAKLLWLAGKLPVPQVYYFNQSGGISYLLMSAIPGQDTSDRAYEQDVPAMVRRLVHSVPINGCPFNERLAVKLARASRRTAAGLVDTAEFGEQFHGKSAGEWLAELESGHAGEEDLVFTHGDYCLPNVLLQAGQLSGFIDLGSAGVADRYQDLALGARSLARNFGAEWIPLFFAAYGIEAEPHKVIYYQLLDEFF